MRSPFNGLKSLVARLQRSLTPLRKPKSRRARRTSLGLECLEAREVLSASFPGYSLSNGNLYNTSGAQQQLIDTGVQNFTVVNHKVIDLHTSGTLEAMNSDGSGKAILDTTGSTAYRYTDTYSSFLVDGAGSVVALGADGYLSRFAPGSTQGGWIDSNVSSYVVDGAGSVVTFNHGAVARFAPGSFTRQYIDSNVTSYVVDGAGSLVTFNNGSLARFAPGSFDRQYIDSNVTSFAVDGAGAVVTLNTGGALAHFAPGSFDRILIGSGIQSFGVRSDGDLYVLHSNNDLTLNSPAGTQLVDFGTVQGFAMGAAGGAYFVQNGNLNLNTPPRTVQVVIGGVQTFCFRSDGLIYVLHSNTDLSLYTSGGQLVTDFGMVQGSAIGEDGKAYYLQNGTLFHDGQANWSIPSVQSFAIGGDGKAYYLQNGTLYHEGDSSVAFPSVISFAIGGDGMPYFLQTNGVLFHQGAPAAVDTDVAAFVLSPTGVLAIIHRITFSDGQLIVAGTDQSDTILLGQDNGVIWVNYNGSRIFQVSAAGRKPK